MNIIKQVVLLIICFMLCYCPAFSQEIKEQAKDEKESLTKEDVSQAFEKALKSVESEKQKSRRELTAELESKLNLAIGDWLNSEKNKTGSESNKIIDQKWELLPKFGPRVHYDYYLRNFSFDEIKTDIISTDSLVTPYKATLNAIKNLFVEKTHSPNVVNIDKFIFTVCIPVIVHFEYRQNNFVATDTIYGQPVLMQGWAKNK